MREIGLPFFTESESPFSQNGMVSKQWDVLILNLLDIEQEAVSLALIKQKLWQLAMADGE